MENAIKGKTKLSKLLLTTCLATSVARVESERFDEQNPTVMSIRQKLNEDLTSVTDIGKQGQNPTRSIIHAATSTSLDIIRNTTHGLRIFTTTLNSTTNLASETIKAAPLILSVAALYLITRALSSRKTKILQVGDMFATGATGGFRIIANQPINVSLKAQAAMQDTIYDTLNDYMSSI